MDIAPLALRAPGSALGRGRGAWQRRRADEGKRAKQAAERVAPSRAILRQSTGQIIECSRVQGYSSVCSMLD